MLLEQDLLATADAYRDMANKALAPRLRLEFNERAERYETVASILKQGREPSARPKVSQ